MYLGYHVVLFYVQVAGYTCEHTCIKAGSARFSRLGLSFQLFLPFWNASPCHYCHIASSAFLLTPIGFLLVTGVQSWVYPSPVVTKRPWWWTPNDCFCCCDDGCAFCCGCDCFFCCVVFLLPVSPFFSPSHSSCLSGYLSSGFCCCYLSCSACLSRSFPAHSYPLRILISLLLDGSLQ